MKKIKFLTAGESHGKLLMGILEGIPSNLEIDEAYIHKQLQRRQLGFGRGKRMQIESDYAKIYTGVRLGKTLGSPIGMVIQNKDWENWKNKMSIKSSDLEIKKITLPRPGHADLAGALKYDFDDIRNVIERSSARETAMRVAIGSICRKLLEHFHIYIGSYVSSIYKAKDPNDYSHLSPQEINEQADKSQVRSLNLNIEKEMIEHIANAKEKGDSVGGSFNILVKGVPYGLGSYVSWDSKLNARLGQAILSINGIKSVSVGDGSNSENKPGSQLHDEIDFDKKFIRLSNNCGGIEGGIGFIVADNKIS